MNPTVMDHLIFIPLKNTLCNDTCPLLFFLNFICTDMSCYSGLNTVSYNDWELSDKTLSTFFKYTWPTSPPNLLTECFFAAHSWSLFWNDCGLSCMHFVPQQFTGMVKDIWIQYYLDKWEGIDQRRKYNKSKGNKCPLRSKSNTEIQNGK